jgi:hypothetical protein
LPGLAASTCPLQDQNARARLIQINADISAVGIMRRRNGKGSDMKTQQSSGSPRRLVTRALATGALLIMYAFGMIATASSPAFAQRGRGRGRGWGGDVGAGVALGIGAAVIGGAIIAGEAQRRDAIGYCMQRFRSYDPESMTYVGRDGLRHPCP